MKNILVIKDDKIGTYKQALALATFIEDSYEEISLQYNFLSKLPNFILRNSIFHISNKQDLSNLNFKPDLVIGAGRKTVPVCKYIKRKTGAKIVQIMWTRHADKDFDLVITPKHDNVKEIPGRVMNSIGALSSITPEKIHEIYLENQYKFIELSRLGNDKSGEVTRDFIALIVGGNQKNLVFTKENAMDLVTKVNKLAEDNNCNIIYTTSRRTPEDIKNYITSHLTPNSIDINALNIPNSYMFLLAAAKYFIATGDSVSMCSEVAATGKSLYIFAPKNICNLKQTKFHQELYNHNFARPLSDKFEIWPHKPLQETRYFAQYIKDNLL